MAMGRGVDDDVMPQLGDPLVVFLRVSFYRGIYCIGTRGSVQVLTYFLCTLDRIRYG